MYIFISYDLTAGYIFYAAWLPNIISETKVTKLISLTASFHSAMPSTTKIELLYWGTNDRFCGRINRVVYYPNYAINSVDEWMIQALTDGSKSAEMLLYLRLEASDATT